MFHPPGPGHWQLDAVHHPTPVTPFLAACFPEPAMRAFDQWSPRYGAPIGELQIAFVNGLSYLRLRPLDPEDVPARATAAAKVLETRPWRADFDAWEEELRPRLEAASLELQRVGLTRLSDEQLQAEIDRCRRHLQEVIHQHMSLNGAYSLAMGEFILRLAEWLGLEGAEAVRAAGSVLCTSSKPAPDRDTRLAGPLGWLSYRVLDGVDLDAPLLSERPRALANVVRYLTAPRPESRDRADREAAQLRRDLPAAEREAFDEYLVDARRAHAAREERGSGDAWAAGLARRAVLEGGRRLAARGRIEHPADLLEADPAEVEAVLGSGEGPSPGELAERGVERRSRSAREAPRWIGEPPPQGDTVALPAPLARVGLCITVLIESVFRGAHAWEGERDPAPDLLRGFPASPGTAEGPAYLGLDSRELSGEGAVLVIGTSTVGLTAVWPPPLAVVTDHGGVLSHAAIFARELGIPAVTGCERATEAIPPGARVRVDGDAGEVRVLGQ